jgi:hypothetical protein
MGLFCPASYGYAMATDDVPWGRVKLANDVTFKRYVWLVFN